MKGLSLYYKIRAHLRVCQWILQYPLSLLPSHFSYIYNEFNYLAHFSFFMHGESRLSSSHFARRIPTAPACFQGDAAHNDLKN